MSILDRYLFRLFLRSYFMFFFSMLGLYVMIDIAANADEFGKDHPGIGVVVSRILRYYGWHTFDYFGRLSPIITQMAAMYTLAELRRYNELTPIVAAGIPTRRAMVPVLAGVCFVIAMGVANREYAMPYFAEYLERSHDDVEGVTQLQVGSRIDSEAMLVRADKAFRDGHRLVDVKITLPDLQEVTAAGATFLTGANGKPGILLDDAKPKDLRESEKVLKTADGKTFLPTTLTFREMVRSNSWTRFASGMELVDELGKPEAMNAQEVRALIHNRIMQPVANFVLVLLGIPFVLSWERNKFYISLLISMFLSAGYFVLDSVATYLAGFGYFDPMFAAWLPIFIFLPIASSLSHRIGT